MTTAASLRDLLAAAQTENAVLKGRVAVLESELARCSERDLLHQSQQDSWRERTNVALAAANQWIRKAGGKEPEEFQMLPSK